MFVTSILYISLIISAVHNAELRDRKLSRLVGGHIRLKNPTSNDAELLEAQSSSSKERNFKENTSKNETSNSGDEERKTLSQQVSEGKYGLIHRELFKKPLKQPGVISYDDNPEIPSDNINNLGGLNKEDIWLAENHLLVLKGGTYPKHDNKLENSGPVWPAIDNYTAPKRPVKISLNPKIPPPFPVQLTEDGPLQILGATSSGPLDGPPPVFAVPTEGGYIPGTGPFFRPHTDQANSPPRGTSNQVSSKTPGEEERGPPFPPSLNGTNPPYFVHLPPGAMAVPPPVVPPSINDFNEDDPSIYYPPPYSFSYPTLDNSSNVAAGPLVPGIILPPPPDFFSVLEEPTKPSSTKRPTVYTKRPKQQKENPIRTWPTTTTTPPASQITLKKPIQTTPNEVYKDADPPKTTTSVTKSYSKLRPFPSRSKTKPPAVTILKPVKSSEPHVTYYSRNAGKAKPFAVYGPPTTKRVPETLSSIQPPLKNYYNNDEVNFNTVTITPERTTLGPAEYYYYEEEPRSTTSSPNRIVQNIFNLPSHYFEPPKQIQSPRPQFIYVTAKPVNPSNYNLPHQNRQSNDNFQRNLANLKKQIDVHTSPKPMFREIHSPRPVYQYSFQAANYKPQNIHSDFKPSNVDSLSDTQDDSNGFRPMPKYSVQIEPAIEISVDQRLPHNPIYFQETFRTSTPKSVESQDHYTTAKPLHNFQKTTNKRGRNANKHVQYSAQSDNTDLDGYYVKPNLNYYKANNQHFSAFGQRIPNHTTALPRYTTRSPNVIYITAGSKLQSRPNPISLQGDTLVNYIRSRPVLNPDAQFIPIKSSVNYPLVSKYGPPIQHNPNPQQQNLKHRQQITIEVPNEDDIGSFITYPLPGDNGAHFYFRTPQLIHRTDQDNGYFYPQVGNDRLRKSNGNENKR